MSVTFSRLGVPLALRRRSFTSLTSLSELGGRQGGREGEKEGGMEGGMEGGRQGGREGGRERGREGEREGGETLKRRRLKTQLKVTNC